MCGVSFAANENKRGSDRSVYKINMTMFLTLFLAFFYFSFYFLK